MKRQITANCSSAFIKALNSATKVMGLSRNAYIETAAILECLNNDRYNFNEQELNELWDDLPTKGSCKITKDFTKLHKRLPQGVKLAFLKFFYEINLINTIKFSAIKQANFYKRTDKHNEEYLFYYGIIEIKNHDIQEYVNKLDIVINTYGEQNGENFEYMYLGREQQFKHATIKSNLFSKICCMLDIDQCDCVKIHYSSFDKLVSVLKKL